MFCSSWCVPDKLIWTKPWFRHCETLQTAWVGHPQQPSQQCSSALPGGLGRAGIIFGVCRCLLDFPHQDGNSDLFRSVWSCLPLVAALHQGLGGSAQRLRLSALPNQNLSHRICKQLTQPHCSRSTTVPMHRHNQLLCQAPGLENLGCSPNKPPFFKV